MRDAERTLEVLGNISTKNQDYRFKRLYENLYNEDFYIRAYLKLAPHEGNMTKGTDGKTIDGFGFETVESIIQRMKLEQYRPKPSRLKYIEKKNGKLRPLGVANFEDKLVQEVIREILEAIYEPIFKDSSHGFRPGRSCHTAMRRIQLTGKSSSWAIEGDLSNFFGSIDHDILLRILSKRIDDGRLLELIRKFLKAGYLNGPSFEESDVGTPQGSVLSPILANIYLHEFDEFMETLKLGFDKGKHRKVSKEYQIWISRWRRAKEGIGRYGVKESHEQMVKLGTTDPMDPDFRRLQYTRYADDFMVFIIGSKAEASEIRDQIADYLSIELNLVLNLEKTKITNLNDENPRFLGFEIHKLKHDPKNKHSPRKSANGSLTLLMPKDVIDKKMKEISKGYKPVPRKGITGFSVEHLIRLYNAEFEGLYNYYAIASNVSGRMRSYRWMHLRSLQRTIAMKERIPVGKVLRKYSVLTKRKDGHGMRMAFGIARKGKPPVVYFDKSIVHKTFPQDLPRNPSTEFGTELRERLLRKTCEVCGSHDSIEVHHVRNLGETVNSYKEKKKALSDWVRLMNNQHRKTLVLCSQCHKALHRGRLKIPEERLGSGLRGNVHGPF